MSCVQEDIHIVSMEIIKDILRGKGDSRATATWGGEDKRKRKLTKKYLQKKSLGTVWKRQKSSLEDSECAWRGRPTRSVGGQSNVQVGTWEGSWMVRVMSIARTSVTSVNDTPMLEGLNRRCER